MCLLTRTSRKFLKILNLEISELIREYFQEIPACFLHSVYVTSDMNRYRLILYNILFSFCVYEYFAFIYIGTPGVCSAQGGQKGAPNPLKLEFQTFVSCHVNAGNRTWVFYKSSKCS